MPVAGCRRACSNAISAPIAAKTAIDASNARRVFRVFITNPFPGGGRAPIELPPRGHTVGASGRGVNLGGGVPGAAGVSYSRCAPAILLKSSVHS